MTPAAWRLVHAAAGSLALLTILTFWTSTVAVELAGSAESIVAVKRAIPWGLLVLVPAMAATAGTGMALARNAGGPLVRRKLLRMRVVGALGVLVLAPSVLYLGLTATVDDLDASFYAVQSVELVAGAVNITLLGLNVRDGLRLSAATRRRPRTGPGAPSEDRAARRPAAASTSA